ncbi:hypothetical protein [Shewanella violacea]|uniref:hypothetical protein n=1 Tax=Shewanella violacea TaxID=60217 RepID=UPI002F421E4F
MKLFTNQTGNLWTVLVFTILTLFCLTQNSGILKLLLAAKSVPETSAVTMIASSIDISDSVAEQALDSPKHTGLGFKKCELSEKSMRVCMDLTDSFPLLVLLVLLFSLPLFPLISLLVKSIPSPSHLAKPRRIHLSLCRFQE